jgi:hypothetical protein
MHKIVNSTSSILPVSLDTQANYTLIERSYEIGNDCHSNSVCSGAAEYIGNEASGVGQLIQSRRETEPWLLK